MTAREHLSPLRAALEGAACCYKCGGTGRAGGWDRDDPERDCEECRTVRSALALLSRMEEEGEIRYMHRVTGNVYSALDVGRPDHPEVLRAFRSCLVLPLPGTEGKP